MENTKLSDKLKAFKESYEANKPDTVASCDIPEQLNKVSLGLQSAISCFRLSGKDKIINSIVADVSLANEGVQRIKSHIDAEIPAVLAQLKSVHESIAKIEENVKDLEGKESQLSGIIGSTILDADSRKESLNREIKALKDKIEAGNTKAESQLDGIASALDGVDFGVKGCMKSGGALTAGSSYDYKLEGEGEPPSEEGNNDTPKTDGLKYENGYVVVDNINDFQAALATGKPVKLVKGLKYRYSFGLFGLSPGWDDYPGSEDKPLYLRRSDKDKNHYIVVDENGTPDQDYKDKFIEVYRIVNQNQGYVVSEGKKDGKYTVVSNVDEFLTAMDKTEPIKIESDFHYYVNGKYETYTASKDKPIYFTLKDNKWQACDENGTVLTEYNKKYLQKDQAKFGFDSYFSTELTKDSDGISVVNNMSELKTALDKGEQLKLESTFCYPKNDSVDSDLTNWAYIKATKENPLYLKQDSNNSNDWLVVDKNGNVVGEYKDIKINKKRVFEQTKGCFGDNK